MIIITNRPPFMYVKDKRPQCDCPERRRIKRIGILDFDSMTWFEIVCIGRKLVTANMFCVIIISLVSTLVPIKSILVEPIFIATCE